MRRPRVLVALLTMLVLVAASLPAMGAPDDWNLNSAGLTKVSITMDGRPMNFSGYIVNDRTVAPLRAIFEALSVEIKWDPDTYGITATKGNKVIKLNVGKTGATIDGKAYEIAVPPVLIDSKTFVPVRFIVDALGLDVKWDGNTNTVMINTGSDCALTPYQKHEGTISPGGETWGKCGSPHVVTGEFRVEGTDSPILTIEAGTVIRFEQDARILVGVEAPGGFVVNGTVAEKALFTADSSGPQPGFWGGIYFGKQTLINDSRIKGAKFEYAGGFEGGAITIEGYERMVEVQLNDVEIANSQYAGLLMTYQGRLRAGSAGLKITGTVGTDSEGGFPIVTAVVGSHNLPRGEFSDNDVNAVNIFENGAGAAYMATNTTWRNVSIPYVVSQEIYVEGNASPTLTVEPGVIVLFGSDTGLIVGWHGPGHLVADATAKPEGTGDWLTGKTWPANWNFATNEDLSIAGKLGSAVSIGPICSLCGNNRAIVFGAWNGSPERGAWEGVRLGSMAGDKSRLVGTVIAYGGTDNEYNAGLYAEANQGKTVKFLLADSLIMGAARSGMEFYGNAQLRPESTGNVFANNGWPIQLQADAIGYLPAGQTFTENDRQTIHVSMGTSESVTKSATWRNQGIPYQFDLTVYIGGTAAPVVTVEPGTTLVFDRDAGLKVGSTDGTGSLVAVGASGKPIKFTSDTNRAGAWDGLHFTEYAGAGNRLEFVTIEYANVAVGLDLDLGGFIRNTTIRSSAEMGIYRGYDLTGTSFTRGLGNQFEGNAVDENEE